MSEIYLLILIVIILQIGVFFYTLRNTKIFKNIFPKSSNPNVITRYFSDEELAYTYIEHILNNLDNEEYKSEGENKIEITLIEHETNTSKIYNDDIQHSINRYIIRNKGAAVDFNIIKDITERNCDTLDESVNLTIAIPLYLGIMGTILGIVIGLYNITFPLTDKGTSILLNSVRIAMIASFAGILLTTLSSGIFYRNAKNKNEVGKNKFYSFIQSDLLPVLPGIESSLQVLQRNLTKFNEEFSINIDVFGENMSTTQETIKLLYDTVDKIQNLDISKIAKSNIEVFNALQDNITVFEKFNINIQNSASEFSKFDAYLANINGFVENSNKLILLTDELYTRFNNFNNNIENISAEIGNRLDQSQKLLDFLDTHLSFLAERKQAISDTIVDIDKFIQKLLTELSEHTQDRINEVRNITIKEDVEFQKALDESKDNLGKLAFLENIKNDFHSLNNNLEELIKLNKEQAEDIKNSIENSIKPIDEKITETKEEINNKSIIIQSNIENGLKTLNENFNQTIKVLKEIDKNITYTQKGIANKKDTVIKQPKEKKPEPPTPIKRNILLHQIDNFRNFLVRRINKIRKR